MTSGIDLVWVVVRAKTACYTAPLRQLVERTRFWDELLNMKFHVYSIRDSLWKLYKFARAAGSTHTFMRRARRCHVQACAQKKGGRGRKKNNLHLMYTSERSGEKWSEDSCGVSPTKSWTHMVGHVFTCMFGAQPRGIASLPACSPAAPAPHSFGWDVTRQGSAAIWFRKRCGGCFGWREGEGLPTSLWAWHI